jgi:nucleoid-associated protein YgaU
MVWETTRPAPEPVPAETADAPAALVSKTPVASDLVPEAVPEAVAAEPGVPEPPAPPEIGTWLVTAEGAATVAGTAVPDALVRVLVDGVAVAETKATGSGEFALVTDLAPNPAPSLMTLVMVLEDGTEVPSVQSVALGPIAGPAPVAVADVAPDEPAAPAEPAAEPPAALMLTEEGATVLQDPAEATAAAPGEVAPVTLETIAYTATGAVQLGGSGQPGAFVRIYLDNALVQEVLIPDSGKWLTTLKETAPGVYTLRADQVDDAGFVTSRFETPFRRETLEALATAAEAAPEPVAEVAPAAVEPAPEVVVEAPVAEPAPEVVADAPAEVAEPESEAMAEAPAEVAVAAESAAAAPVAEPASEATPEPVADAPAEEIAEAAPETAPVTAAAAPEIVAAPEIEPAAAEPAVPEPVAEPMPEPAQVAEAVPEPAPAAPEPPPPAPPVTVTVQPGHTLWAIAQGQLGEGVMYVQVYEANKDKIRDPDLIYPGQVFTIPAAE